MKYQNRLHAGLLTAAKPALSLLAALALLSLTACGGGGGGGGAAPTDNIVKRAYLKASDAGADDLFGGTKGVALDGDTLVVGASGEASDSGAVYVFTRDVNGVWSEQVKLKASNAGAGDLFGDSVALEGDTLVVGASGEASAAGAVYVFTRESNGDWTEQAILTANNAGANDKFGTSVALEGDTLVVGAPGEASSVGAVYVFTREVDGIWTEQDMLKASNAGAGDTFGFNVALSGNTLVVSAFGEDGVNNNFSNAGAVYVFTRDVDGIWTEQVKLKASNAGAGDRFGSSVALSGDTLAVGAIGEDDIATDSGAVYVFTRDVNGVWSEQVILKASNAGADDQFGFSVALEGDTLVVGANIEDGDASSTADSPNDKGFENGAAYVFTRSGTNWSQQAYLKASNTDFLDRFGVSVALSGDTVVVGAPQEDGNANSTADNPNDNASQAGAVYVFQ